MHPSSTLRDSVLLFTLAANRSTKRVMTPLFFVAPLAWPTLRPQTFGARADGVHNDTDALRAAIRACGAGGGCDLRLGNGTFLAGPLDLPSNSRVVIEPSGTLLALPMDRWRAAGWWHTPAFLNGNGLTNVSLTGGGTIDGNGADWWNVTKDDRHYRPHLIRLTGTRGLVIDGVLCANSPNHNIYVDNTDGLRIRNVRVHAPPHSPNTDGINVAGGRDQLVADSHISNGDDCLSVVTGTPAHDGAMGYGGHVVVRNVTCVWGHGLSIGSVRVSHASAAHREAFRHRSAPAPSHPPPRPRFVTARWPT